VKPDERRAADRYEVTWSVDCETPDTFLYASITNISALGIFVRTNDPLPIGTRMTLRFAPPGEEPFALHGLVQWVNPFRIGGDNPNPGMGIQFAELTGNDRERLIEIIKTIAYVREDIPRERAN
jgi:type IV pilus assembly protein PilZ